MGFWGWLLGYEEKKEEKSYCEKTYLEYYPDPVFSSSVGYMSTGYKNLQHMKLWEDEHRKKCPRKTFPWIKYTWDGVSW